VIARAALALAVAAVLLIPGAAGAAVRLGPDITKPLPSGGFHLGATGCQQTPSLNPCAFLNLRSTNPDVVVAAPFDGVITSWSFRAGCCTDPQTVAHHLTLGTFRLGAQDGAYGYAYADPDLVGPTFELPAGNQVVADAPTTLPARVPIATGERVGVSADWPIAFSLDDTVPGVTYTSLANGYNYGYANTGAVLEISAQVEPDADRDGYGDETQDCAPADAATHDVGCAPVVAVPAPPLPLPVYIPCPAGGGCSAPAGSGSGGGGATTTPPAPPAIGPIPPSSDPNSVYLALTCPPNATQHCGGYLILVPGGAHKAAAAAAAAAARTRYTITPGKTKKVAIPLTAALRRTLRRTGRVTVTLRLQPDGGAPGKAFTRTVKVKVKVKHKPAKR